jgi:hypothetical protein
MRNSRESSACRAAMLVFAAAITLALSLTGSSAFAGERNGSASGLSYGSTKKAPTGMLALAKSGVGGVGAPFPANGFEDRKKRTLERTVANSASYTDSTGEDAAAPDITTITVSSDDAGLTTFQIAIPNRPTYTGDMIFDTYIDSDNNTGTGDQDGDDYEIGVLTLPDGRTVIFLARWNGVSYDLVDASTLSGSYGNGVNTMSISSAELGGTTGFAFITFALSGVVVTGNGIDYSNAHGDRAPDVGSYFYSLTPPPPPPPPPPPVSRARLQGTFNVALRVTSNNNFGQAVGTTSTEKRSGATYTLKYRRTYRCGSGSFALVSHSYRNRPRSSCGS